MKPMRTNGMLLICSAPSGAVGRQTGGEGAEAACGDPVMKDTKAG